MRRKFITLKNDENPNKDIFIIKIYHESTLCSHYPHQRRYQASCDFMEKKYLSLKLIATLAGIETFVINHFDEVRNQLKVEYTGNYVASALPVCILYNAKNNSYSNYAV